MFIPTKKQSEEILGLYGSPVYVTDAETIKEKANKIINAFSCFNTKIFYAVKANYNPKIIEIIKQSGIYGIDAVSTNEIKLALKLGYTPEQIIFTPSNPSDKEISYAGQAGILQNLGSLSELKRFGELFSGSDVSIRICPEVGAGESDKVTTGQTESKFGVALDDIENVKQICTQYNLSIVGIHSHIGSGFYETSVFKKSVQSVCDIARQFGSIKFLDFGGGFGVEYNPEKSEIDLNDFANSIREIISDFEKDNKKEIEIRIEPGKFLVSQSTVLLTTVTTVKKKGEVDFIGVDSGFHNLIRPAMYDSYHHIVNISCQDSIDDKLKLVQVVGNVCETCDIFNHAIHIKNPKEGDILAILSAGGYGSSMSSNYNLRQGIAEVLIDQGNTILTKKSQTFEQVIENFVM